MALYKPCRARRGRSRWTGSKAHQQSQQARGEAWRWVKPGLALEDPGWRRVGPRRCVGPRLPGAGDSCVLSCRRGALAVCTS